MISKRRRRHLSLAALAVFGYVAGIPLTRLLDSYRGVVLEQDGNKVHVAYLDRMPRWRAIGAVPPGAIVSKGRGAWQAKAVEPLGRDIPLKALYDRFYASYEAHIVSIEKPDFLGAAANAVAERADGSHVRLILGAPHLTSATVGTWLRKTAKSWDPDIIDAQGAGSPKS